MKFNPYTFRPNEADPQSAISFYQPVEVKGYKYFRRKRPRGWVRVPGYFYYRWVVLFPDLPQRRKVKGISGWIRAWKAEEMERHLREKEFPIARIGGHFQHTNRSKDWFHIKDKFVYYRRALPLRVKLSLARIWFWVLSTAGPRKNWHYELWVYTFSTGRRGYFPKYQDMKHHILDEEAPAVFADLEERIDYIEVVGLAGWSAWAGMQKIPYHRGKK